MKLRSSRAFAVVLVVVLLAFLVLLVVALATFARIETAVAANQGRLAQAREHALVGLSLALGQLQRHAGPDRRATARATFVGGAAANKSQWSGVWGDPADPPVWLVSSPPGTRPDPTNPAYTDPVVLVGNATAEITGAAANDPDQVRVDAIPLTVPAAWLPGWSEASDPIVGRTAYWVGEEAGKLSVAGRDERGPLAGGAGPDPWPRIDPGPFWGGFDVHAAGIQAALAQALAYGQLEYVDAAFTPVRLRRNYHRATLLALGVLANPAAGGLKTEGGGAGPDPYAGEDGPRYDELFLAANPAPGTDPDGLPAARFVVHRRAGEAPPVAALSGPGAAAHLLVAGAFNVNAIDPDPLAQRDKWRAVLAAARTLTFPGGAVRALGASELDALAAQMTALRLRAGYTGTDKRPNEPFRSLGGFARSQVLQAALDATPINDGRTPDSPDYVGQADLLAWLAPILAVRSDTFVIRAYGEVHNPILGTREGEAWCEALVQRVPDYVDPDDAPGDTPNAPDNQAYGRRFVVTSFRWLTAADL